MQLQSFRLQACSESDTSELFSEKAAAIHLGDSSLSVSDSADRLHSELLGAVQMSGQQSMPLLGIGYDTKAPTLSDTTSMTQSQSPSSFSHLQMRFRAAARCESWCPCACHKHQHAQSWSFLRPFFGSLYAGYSGMPVLSPKCNVGMCKGMSAGYLKIDYLFPSWFTARAVSIAVLTSPSYGPELCLRILNVRSAFDTTFRLCVTGDCAALEQMIKSGKASVLDISDESSHSYLHVAMRTSQLDVVRTLLKLGADPHLENAEHE